VQTAFLTLLPETILIIAGCLFIFAGSFPARRGVWGWWSLIAIGAAAFTEFNLTRIVGNQMTTIPSLVLNDQLSSLFHYAFLLLGALFTLTAMQDRDHQPNAAEFFGLLLNVVAGMMIVASANELILLFLGLELISIPMYVLLYLGRRGYPAQEASVKYFLLSIASAAILLYGFALLYGVTGATNLSDIREILLSIQQSTVDSGGLPIGPSRLAMVSIVLILAGLAFKITAVPFHFYAPDVYQGTNAWNAGLLAVVPKAAGFIAMVRIVSHSMPGLEITGQTVALIMALFTMTLGNVLALLQTNVRRLLAYSSIAHAGYMLVGFAVGFWNMTAGAGEETLFGLPGGIQSSLFYLIAYVLASAGVFSVLIYLAQDHREVEDVEDLAGLWKSKPLAAICLALFLFSMAGIPPLPGFWGKMAVFASALSVHGSPLAMIPLPNIWFLGLAVVGALNAAIGAVYYLKVIALMFLYDPQTKSAPAKNAPAWSAMVISAVLTLALGLQARPLFDAVREIGPSESLQQMVQEPVPSTEVAER